MLFYVIVTCDFLLCRCSTEKELNKKRRDGYLADSWSHLTDKILMNDRICSKHFISSKPAYLHDTTNPDWLPTLCRGTRLDAILEMPKIIILGISRIASSN